MLFRVFEKDRAARRQAPARACVHAAVDSRTVAQVCGREGSSLAYFDFRCLEQGARFIDTSCGVVHRHQLAKEAELRLDLGPRFRHSENLVAIVRSDQGSFVAPCSWRLTSKARAWRHRQSSGRRTHAAYASGV